MNELISALLPVEDFGAIKNQIELRNEADQRELHVILANLTIRFSAWYVHENYKPKDGEIRKCVKKALNKLKQAKGYLEDAHSVTAETGDPDFPSQTCYFENEFFERIEDMLGKEIIVMERALKLHVAKPGRPQKNYLRRLIVELADIYERFTDKKATSIKDTNAATVKKPPPFQAFAKICLEKFKVSELFINETIDQNIHKALEFRRGKK